MDPEHHTESESFVAHYRRSLANATLQRALSVATGKALKARRVAVDQIGESHWELLRERAREIKVHTVSNLDFYLDKFTSEVERAGGHVFWAQTADEASRYIVELARRRRIKVVVKGKSMMSEEIDLNSALLAAGIDAVETDLGECIVQLAGERPSHINMPAVHKTRDDVADLFEAKLKVKRPVSIREMSEIARCLLRKRFAEAGMGITGVNYAVAETGAIVLVENEGNIRLTTSLPRVHVAVMGIEKVVPRLVDVDVFLRLLSRSASGQKLCSYVSFLKGVKRAEDEEGPEEFHVVLIDNGRVEMLANPHLRESLNCIRCGACLNVCPVYQKIGGHAYGWVYPGPIGSILTPQMKASERAAELPFASSLCGACRDVCPVKIDIPGMLLHLRREIKEGGPEKSTDRALPGFDQTAALGRDDVVKQTNRMALRSGGIRPRVEFLFESVIFKIWAVVMKRAWSYRIATRWLRLVQKFFGSVGSSGERVLPISRWTATRELPPIASLTFRELWPSISIEPAPPVTVADAREGPDFMAEGRSRKV